jgi:hypothetical protein
MRITSVIAIGDILFEKPVMWTILTLLDLTPWKRSIDKLGKFFQ